MDASESPEAVETRLRDLRESDRPVSFVARVIAAERRQVRRKTDGSERPVLSGLLSDGTATVRFTWWDPPSEVPGRGDVIRVAQATARMYQGLPEISIGWRTRVGPAHPSELPTIDPADIPDRALSELQPRDEGFRVRARVVEVSEKKVTVGEDQRQVFTGLLADSAGTLGFTAWSDFSIRRGEVLVISGAYVRSFRGRPELVLDERCRVERTEDASIPDTATLENAPPVSIALVEEGRGGARVRVEGIVLGLMPPSGVVMRCPQCRRSVRQGTCRVHGTVIGTPDLRARIVLDDGTGVLTVNVERPEAERLFGRTLPECLEQLKSRPDTSALEAELLDKLFGERLRVTGSARADDFGVTLTPQVVERIDSEPSGVGIPVPSRSNPT